MEPNLFSETLQARTYITVILPLHLEWEPCYYVCEPVEKGDRVRVKFAHREYSGVVSAVGMKPDVDVSRIQPVLSVERELDRIGDDEISLWRCVASYYLCTVGEVYKAAYPSVRIGTEMAQAESLRKAAERAARREEMLRQKAAGTLRRIEERMEKRRDALSRARKEEVKQRLNEEMKLLEKEKQRLESILNAPETQNSTSREYEEESSVSCPELAEIVLSDCQEQVCRTITDAFRAGKPVLLQGVTGSGKTEIYSSFAREVLEEGFNVLYLVPEIAISSQLSDRLRSYFADALQLYHSGVSAAEKRRVAEYIRKEKEPYIALGTRSSLFLPHRKLGLIIVDEEQDNSYKQDSPSPRYNGRDVALMLAAQTGARVILGSATPSLESLYNCKTGKYAHVRLDRKYYEGEDAEIQIIDTVAERKKNGMKGNFSRKLLHQMEVTLAEGGQIALLRARRSYSLALQCSECGKIIRCPRCNVSMSVHGREASPDSPDTRFLMCHHCGYRRNYVNLCPDCGREMRGIGAGTQKIEEEVKTLFPQASVARLDGDTAGGAAQDIIRDFSEGKTDILVGTQMLSKGFDFSGLRLVAVIQADTLLSQQDFRADERALQLFEQFRGRCSRRGEKGKFIIQTSQSQHPIYRELMSGNTDAYLDSILAERLQFGFPPLTRIVNVIIRDTSESRLNRMSGLLASALRNALDIEITGPFPPPVAKVGGQHIRHIRASFPKSRALALQKETLLVCVRDFEKKGKYQGHIVLDVDPV